MAVDLGNGLPNGVDGLVRDLGAGKQVGLADGQVYESFPLRLKLRHLLPDAGTPRQTWKSPLRYGSVEILLESPPDAGDTECFVTRGLQSGPRRRHGPSHVGASIPFILRLVREGSTMKGIGPNMVVGALYDLGAAHYIGS